jgi:hypothetical protein
MYLEWIVSAYKNEIGKSINNKFQIYQRLIRQNYHTPKIEDIKNTILKLILRIQE